MAQSALMGVDWGWLGRQLPWVLGLSLILAVLSWGDWAARVRGMRRRDLFAQPQYDLVLSLGLALFTVGLALNATHWWEPYLWLAFTLVWLVQAGRAFRQWRRVPISPQKRS